MRIVLQRVSSARVEVGGEIIGRIGTGLVLLLAIAHGDTRAEADYLAVKVAGLRVFDDSAGKMNLSIRDIGGAALVISQFTLYADTRKGRRPSYDGAARPEQARELYDYFSGKLASLGIEVATGTFQATMSVHLINEGPVTLICDSVTMSPPVRKQNTQ